MKKFMGGQPWYSLRSQLSDAVATVQLFFPHLLAMLRMTHPVFRHALID